MATTYSTAHLPPSNFQQIKVSLDGNVAIIHLNRPERLNAWTNIMSDELVECFGALDRDDRVKVIVVTGSGRAFCAGADLQNGLGARNAPGERTHRDTGGQTTCAIINTRKPVIAAINGPAVGVGITMCLPMDFRITHKANKIGFVFVRRGIVPEAASTFYLPRLIGYSRTMRLFMGGQIHLGNSPLLKNLFTEVTDTPEQVLPAALALAREIGKENSATSMAMIKTLIWRNPGSPEETHLLDSKAMFTLGNGPDAKEGVDSFLEKRDAKFTQSVKDMPAFLPWWESVDISSPKL
ncbi:hypothetical protein SmJEL517_g04933 [Synchytrium microbalum]|uniref:Enoyl-CoA hydratase n=1 Tax=Synchytrium microbalum TaxID=1806994 RepID=A0A507BRW5_9FUNG|nr:uncharacterized protein SmJEL517_g04933 [Synchytrium microbalum]TPX31847.1 hypothetical protein SmJEL517_g04933 [Synchytrium microbalum]